MRLFNHIIEASFSSLHPWTHFRIHRHAMHKHLVWGRLSVTYGQPHLEEIRICSNCREAISGISAGDEGWDYCEPCHQTEGPTEYITMEAYEREQS